MKKPAVDEKILSLCIHEIGSQTVRDILTLPDEAKKKNALQALRNSLNRNVETWADNPNVLSEPMSMPFASAPEHRGANLATIAMHIARGKLPELRKSAAIRERSWGWEGQGNIPKHLQEMAYTPTDIFLARNPKFLGALRTDMKTRSAELAKQWNISDSDIDLMLQEIDALAWTEKYRWSPEQKRYE